MGSFIHLCLSAVKFLGVEMGSLNHFNQCLSVSKKCPNKFVIRWTDPIVLYPPSISQNDSKVSISLSSGISR